MENLVYSLFAFSTVKGTEELKLTPLGVYQTLEGAIQGADDNNLEQLLNQLSTSNEEEELPVEVYQEVFKNITTYKLTVVKHPERKEWMMGDVEINTPFYVIKAFSLLD